MELASLASRFDDLRRRGVTLLAITADPVEVSRRLGLPFPVLSADVPMLRRWGLLDERADIAHPAWIILDAEGRVRRAWYPDSQRTGVSPDEVMRAL